LKGRTLAYLRGIHVTAVQLPTSVSAIVGGLAALTAAGIGLGTATGDRLCRWGNVKHMSLSERVYSCICGVHLDRDDNAAIYIKKEVIRLLALA